MIHRLYKVRIDRGDGIYGRFDCVNGMSKWLNKRDADALIASSIGNRSNGETEPYYAVLEIEADAAYAPLPENCAYGQQWNLPKGKLLLSTEAEREGKFPAKPREVKLSGQRKRFFDDSANTPGTVS